MWLQRLRQSVHQELPPQSTPQDTHRGETLQVQLGRLHVEVRPFRRADETLPQAHGSQTVPLSRLWPQLLPLWPPGFTQETTPSSVKPSAVQLECNSVLGSVLDYTTLTLKLNGWPYLDCDREWGNVSSGLMFKPFHLIKPKREKKAGCQLTHLRPAHFYRNMVAEPNLWSAVEGPDTFFSFCLQLFSWPESSALLWLHNQNSSSVCASHMACSQASQRNMISSFKAFCFTCIQVNIWDLDTHLHIHFFFFFCSLRQYNVKRSRMYPITPTVHCVIDTSAFLLSFFFFLKHLCQLPPSGSAIIKKTNTPHTSSASARSDHEVMTGC